jgi:hypothetical protein
MTGAHPISGAALSLTLANNAVWRFLLQWSGAVLRYAAATALCLSPIGAVIVVGWLHRRIRWQVARQDDAGAMRPRLLVGAADAVSTWKWISLELGRNIASGVRALIAALMLTLPFSLLWLFAWWAGWENSFNKGYEQAAIGPITALIASAIAALVLPIVPFALAHCAVERRLSAVGEFRRIGSIVVGCGWRILPVSLVLFGATLIAFVARAMPVFAEQVFLPVGMDLSAMDARDLASISGRILFFGSAAMLAGWYLLGSVVSWAYAAGRRTGGGEVSAVLGSWWAIGILCVRFVLVRFLAVATIAIIFVGQFLHHSWSIWLFNPVLVLPWLGL